MRLDDKQTKMLVAPTTKRRMDNAEAARAFDEMIAPLPKTQNMERHRCPAPYPNPMTNW